MIDFQKCVDDYIFANKHKRIPGENEFFPSQVSGCVRQSVINRLGLNNFEIETLRLFQAGDNIHRFIQQEVSLGYIKQPVEFEKQISFRYDKYLFTGHIDCYDGETIYDFKTTSNLEASMKASMPLNYQYQTSLYAHSVNAKHARIVYIDKRNLKIDSKHVDLISMDTIIKFCDSVIIAEQTFKATTKLPPLCKCFPCIQEMKSFRKSK